ncbi:MAG: YeeE/YedE thiosulfate transporter family protein, partial [Hyphomicrobium sp.]
ALTGEAVRQTVSSNLPLVAVAGLLVGFGSVWANGCTSGHGVCGLSRFSIRSLVATLTFMAVAIATVFVTRHVLGG